jgi:biopolymer transport protein ExbB
VNGSTSRFVVGGPVIVLALVMVIAHRYAAPAVSAQQPDAIVDADEIQEVLNDQPPLQPQQPENQPSSIDLLSLIVRGGGFMIPIGIMSLVVVALATERLLSLRRGKVMPSRLVEELDEAVDPIDYFHPSVAFESCREHPSPLARVIGSMLRRTGQPLGEIERTAAETIQREADQYAAPVRWLHLAAAATPLMGLLGTVWGMIVAFHESTTLTAEQSRSEQLSEGIYTALVTTLAGLIVAIPAAIFAQYLENRIVKLFHRIEQFAFEFAPALNRFQGRRRLHADGTLHPIHTPTPPPASAPPGESSTRGTAAGEVGVKATSGTSASKTKTHDGARAS